MNQASETFAASAGRLAGLVPGMLGWSPQALWDATPDELAAILAILRQAHDERAGGEPLGRAELAALMERDGDG